MSRGSSRGLTTRLALAAATCVWLHPMAAHADPGDVLTSFAAPGDSGSGLGWDGRTLWVANLQTALGGGSNRVTWHDPSSGEELGGWNMAFGDVFHGMAFDASGELWTDNFNTDDLLLTDIVHVDRDTGAVLDVYPAYGTIYGVAIDPATDRLFQVDNHSVEPGGGAMAGDLYVVDLGTGGLLDGPIDTGILGARGVAFDGQTLWVASNTTDSLYRIDIETGEQLVQFAAPGAGGVEGLTWDGGCLWYSDTSDDTIYRVDHGQADLPECTEGSTGGTGGGSDDGGSDDGGSSGAGSSDGGSSDDGSSDDAGGSDDAGSSDDAASSDDGTSDGDGTSGDSGTGTSGGESGETSGVSTTGGGAETTDDGGTVGAGTSADDNGGDDDDDDSTSGDDDGQEAGEDSGQDDDDGSADSTSPGSTGGDDDGTSGQDDDAGSCACRSESRPSSPVLLLGLLLLAGPCRRRRPA